MWSTHYLDSFAEVLASIDLINNTIKGQGVHSRPQSHLRRSAQGHGAGEASETFLGGCALFKWELNWPVNSFINWLFMRLEPGEQTGENPIAKIRNKILKYRQTKKPELRSLHRSKRLEELRFPNLLRTLVNCPALDVVPLQIRIPFMKREHVTLQLIGDLQVDQDFSETGVRLAQKAFRLVEAELNKVGMSEHSIQLCMSHMGCSSPTSEQSYQDENLKANGPNYIPFERSDDPFGKAHEPRLA